MATPDQQTTNACSALLELAMSSDVPRSDRSLPEPKTSGEMKDSLGNECEALAKMTSEVTGGAVLDQQEKKVSHQQIINCIVENSIGSYEKAKPNPERDLGTSSPTSDVMNVDSKFRRDNLVNFKRYKSEPYLCHGASSSGIYSEVKSNANSSLPLTNLPSLKPSNEALGDNETFREIEPSYDQIKVPERRKSQRKGKGNRYQTFILEGILQPAKDKRCINGNTLNGHFSKSSLGLKGEPMDQDDHPVTAEKPSEFAIRSVGTVSKSNTVRTPGSSIIDLEEKLPALPQLKVERLTGNRKKRRRRKNRQASSSDIDDVSSSAQVQKRLSSSSSPIARMDVRTCHQHLVGSQKRKARKCCITHLNPNQSIFSGGSQSSENDHFSGLATLARAATENTQPEEHG